MALKNKPIEKKTRLKTILVGAQLAGASLLSAVLVSGLVQAQESTSSSADGVVKEEVVITGSRIRRIDTESANPIVVLSAADIETQGFQSIQEVLSDLPQNSGGSLDQQAVFGFTPAASGVDLRGAGLGRSLTLINGKRLPKYPVAAGGTDNFVDTANIPLGAVERVEILTSGASAIYGSDAMGGVINIILKEEFEGLELKAKFGDTSEGGRETSNIAMVAGAKSETTRLMFFLEHDKKKQLKARERNNFGNLGSDLAFDTPFGSYSSYGVSLRDASTGAIMSTLPEGECLARGLQPTTTGGSANCGFNRSDRRDLFPEMERTSALVQFSMNIAEDLELYSRFDYTFSDFYREIEPMPVADYTYFVGTDSDNNADPGFVTLLSDLSGSTARFDQTTAFGGDFASFADGIYFPTRRMIEFGDRRTRSETDNFTILHGLRGKMGNSWNWDLDWQFSRSTLSSLNIGYASADLYFGYLTSGETGRSVFDVMTEDEVSQAAYLPWRDAESTYTGVSATMDGELFEMSGGTARMAFGAESYKEWFINTSDTESQKGNILSTGGSSGSGDRDYEAVFIETLLPVLDKLDVTLAARYDNYSDFGDHLSPQASLEFRPLETILVRALYAETFRAPDMQRVYGDPTRANSQIIDPEGCRLQGGTLDPGSAIASCNGELYVDVLVGPNSDLGPEEGSNWNLGIIYNQGNFDASIDYWNMEIDDIVNELSAQDIATDFAIYGDLITRNAIGEIDRVNATAQNLSFRETSGIDFGLGYKLPTDQAGTFRFKFTAAYLKSYFEKFSETTPTEDQMEVDRYPDWRANFNLGWEKGSFSSNIYFNYIGTMNGSNIEDLRDADLEIPLTIDSQVKTNVSARYTFREFNFQLGINNLTDEGPELDPTELRWPHYPREYYNAVGRNYYFSTSFKF